MLQVVRQFSSWALRELGLQPVSVKVSEQCPNASASIDVNGVCAIEWNPSFLAQRSPYEVQVITAHEVGHIYNWHIGTAAALHERMSDVVAGWLARRAGILLPRPADLTPLAQVIGLIPQGDYRGGGMRLQDLLRGWSHGEDAEPPRYLRD